MSEKLGTDNILVTRSSMPAIDDYMKEISCLWESRWLTNQGELHNRFALGLRSYLDSFVTPTLFVNGHMALDAAVKVLGLRGEVITTPFTFVSTTHALRMNGIKPIFCDIEPNTYTIDVAKVEALITDKTTAILAVHVYGFPCDVNALLEICRRRGLKLIFDAAHAFGVFKDGTSLANIGDLVMYSFHATKVFHSIEGGALTYGDASLARRLDLIKNFGISGPETIDEIGYNGKMNEFQAAMGICNLRSIDGFIHSRSLAYNLYLELLCDVPGILLPPIKLNGIRMNYSYFPIRIIPEEFGLNRDELASSLFKLGIVVRKYFYPLIPNTVAYEGSCCDDCIPVASEVSTQILTLPLFSELTEDLVRRVCKGIIDVRLGAIK